GSSSPRASLGGVGGVVVGGEPLAGDRVHVPVPVADDDVAHAGDQLALRGAEHQPAGDLEVRLVAGPGGDLVVVGAVVGVGLDLGGPVSGGHGARARRGDRAEVGAPPAGLAAGHHGLRPVTVRRRAVSAIRSTSSARSSTSTTRNTPPVLVATRARPSSRPSKVPTGRRSAVVAGITVSRAIGAPAGPAAYRSVRPSARSMA